MSPKLSSGSLTAEYWAKRWSKGALTWHEPDGNELLTNNLKQVLNESFPNRKAEELKVLVPLCGKAKDMYTFYQMGCTVVGVEFSAQAIKEFFDENNFCQVNSKEKPFVTSIDNKIVLAQGDLFSFGKSLKHSTYALPFPEYDIIWDRGSFEAFNIDKRQEYANFMSQFLSKDGIYLISVNDFDMAKYGGPPFSANRNDLEKVYGGKLDISMVGTRNALAMDAPDRQKWIDRGLSYLQSFLFLMKPKQ